MLPLRMVQIYGTVEPQPKGTPSMKYLVTGAAIAVALTAAAPAFAQSSEFLNSAELYRLAVLRAQAAPAPLPYPLAPYPFYPATADPKTYPLPYYPFAPL